MGSHLHGLLVTVIILYTDWVTCMTQFATKGTTASLFIYYNRRGTITPDTLCAGVLVWWPTICHDIKHSMQSFHKVNKKVCGQWFHNKNNNTPMFGEKSFHNKVTNSMFRSKHTQYSWPGMNYSIVVFCDLLYTVLNRYRCHNVFSATCCVFRVECRLITCTKMKFDENLYK